MHLPADQLCPRGGRCLAPGHAGKVVMFSWCLYLTVTEFYVAERSSRRRESLLSVCVCVHTDCDVNRLFIMFTLYLRQTVKAAGGKNCSHESERV